MNAKYIACCSVLTGLVFSQVIQAAEITTTNLPSGTVMEPYQVTLEGTGSNQWSTEQPLEMWPLFLTSRFRISSSFLYQGDIEEVMCGFDHCIGITSDGRAIEAETSTFDPYYPNSVVAVAISNYGPTFLKQNGRISLTSRNEHLVGLTDVIAIAAGYRHGMALTSSGEIHTWGDNNLQQCDVPTGLNDAIHISCGYNFSLALRNNGTVAAWGDNTQSQLDVPADLRDVIAISGGYRHAVALTSNGTVVAWGNNSYGECDVPANLTNVVAIAAGAYNSAALQNDGKVITWGKDARTPILNVNKLTSSCMIITALREKEKGLPPGLVIFSSLIRGTPEVAGTFEITVNNKDASGAITSKTFELVIEPNPNQPPQLISKEPATDKVKIYADESQTFSVQVNDPENTPLTYQWVLHNEIVGTNSTYILPPGVLSSYGDLECLVSDDFWEDQEVAQWHVSNTDFRLLTETLPAGREMEAYNFQLEIDTTVDDLTWETIPELKIQVPYKCSLMRISEEIPVNAVDIKEVAAGYYHASALRSDGTVVTWGYDPSTSGECVTLNGLGNIVAIGVGSSHSLAIRSDGTVAAWGLNHRGQCNVPENLSNVIQVAGGTMHSLALKDNGTVVAWGNNDRGQLDIPAGLSNVTQIAAGSYHNLALTAEGDLTAWGYNDSRQCDVPPKMSGIVKIAAGLSSSLVLFDDGTIWAWGLSWQEGLEPYSQSIFYGGDGGVSNISCQYWQHSAVQHDGSAILWGEIRATPTVSPEEAIISGLWNVNEIASGADFRLARKSPDTVLPPGLTMSPDGLISGIPEKAGTYAVSVLMSGTNPTNGYGRSTGKIMELVIGPQDNLRPTITNTIPASAGFLIDAGSNVVCSLEASDPEGAPLSYNWVLDGIEVATGTTNYNYQSSIMDTGDHELYCYVSDDLWDEVVYHRWTIGIDEDIDDDGMKNAQELDLARNPSDPGDGGNPAVSLTGSILATHGGLIPGAEVEVCGASGAVYYDAICVETNGSFRIESIDPGTYYIRARAMMFADEWHANALSIDTATGLVIAPDAVIENIDFVLNVGYAPTYAEITSDPSGATIYMNGQALQLTTPATVNLGKHPELSGCQAPYFSVTSGAAAAPPPQQALVEETKKVTLHFDLTTETGAVTLETTPEGAIAYIDYMDVTAFSTPVTVTNLLAGKHIVSFRKDGYLIPKPISVEVTPGTTNLVEIPLTAVNTSNEMQRTVHSIPPKAEIFVNYLLTTNQTDTVIDSLDSSIHSGDAWQSMSHCIHLRKGDYQSMYGHTGEYTFHLTPDSQPADLDADGLPDEWETAYQLRSRAPTANAAQDDPDDDGASNEDEWRAGTNPLLAESVFEVADITAGGTGTTVEFKTVPGNTYLVLHSDSLVGPWTAGTVVTATSDTTTYTIPEGEAATGFIKVILLQP